MTYLTQKEFDALPEYSCSVPTLTGSSFIPGGSKWLKPGAYWKAIPGTFDKSYPKDKAFIRCFVESEGMIYILTDDLEVRN